MRKKYFPSVHICLHVLCSLQIKELKKEQKSKNIFFAGTLLYLHSKVIQLNPVSVKSFGHFGIIGELINI